MMRGLFGMSGLLVGLFGLLLSWQSASFTSAPLKEKLGVVESRRLAEQHYQVRVDLVEGELKSFEIRGDQWQLDARIIAWEGWLSWISARPSIRFERISGRYTDMSQARSGKRSVEAFYGDLEKVDVWSWLSELGDLPGLKMHYGSSVYVPMQDGARYGVYLSHQGLIVKPENRIGERTLESWE